MSGPLESLQGPKKFRTSLSPVECILPTGNSPCLLKPQLKKQLTQTVLSESLSDREYNVKLKADEGSIVYLPCNTRKELHNETIIWDHNMSTIAVMGTLFTMDPRIDVASMPDNRFHKCPSYQSSPRGLISSPLIREDVIEAWELVIDGVQMKDSGDYSCRLTGDHSQSLHYHLFVQQSKPPDRVSAKRIVKIDAPRFARRQSQVTFTCSMQATHDESPGVIIDWFHAPIGHRGAHAQRLIETQFWNNVSVYKEIQGDSKKGLRLGAVVQIYSCDFQHSAVYECQAHHIRLKEKSQLYDSQSVEFTALSRVVLSDSPTEKHGEVRNDRGWFKSFSPRDQARFTMPFQTTSTATSPHLNIFSIMPILLAHF
ncbi:unnamed protein product [Mesocestoides corti]|uniref:Ig-like domain-containing protein n=1 Tax=Mesocestoides corti TaxID=53468 RepID=A0A0R3UGC7_MESCO|nr:unnamed protein product [Mesocestoides corti]